MSHNYKTNRAFSCSCNIIVDALLHDEHSLFVCQAEHMSESAMWVFLNFCIIFFTYLNTVPRNFYFLTGVLFIIPPANKVSGVYRNHPVHPSVHVPCKRNSSKTIFMKLYTFVVHYLPMCLKEYGCCPKFKSGDNSTYTFTKTGGGGGHVPCNRNSY